MSTFEDLSFCFEDFAGKVRLFPLPNLVLFPHVMQPLHVFEPRYRELLEDALAGDRLIAMAVLKPGWESEYEGRPSVYPVACLGRVATYHQLDDGTYNVLLLGLRRVRLLRELEPVRAFREADVELCEDCCPAEADSQRRTLQRKLREAFLKIIATMPEAREQLDQLLDGDVALGMLTDVISYMLELDPADKQSLLSEFDAGRRAELLLEHISRAAGQQPGGVSGKIPFPPQFSVN